MPKYIVTFRTYAGKTLARGWTGPYPSYARSKAKELTLCDQILTVKEASPEEWAALKTQKKARY